MFDVTTLGRSDPAAGHVHVSCRSYDREPILQALDVSRADVVFQLAGTVSGSDEELDRANVGTSRVLLETIWETRPDNPPVVLLVGSAAEYGELPGSGLASETMACAPQSAYGRSKLAQTEMALAWAQKGIPVVVARVFNVLGPGMPTYLAIGRFAAAIAGMGAAGGRLVTGPLHALRDFAALDDVAAVLRGLSSKEQAVGDVTNVCTGSAVTMQDLLTLLIEASGKPIAVEIDREIGGVSAVPRMVGSPEKLESLGLSVPHPDFPRLIGSILEHEHARTARMRLGRMER